VRRLITKSSRPVRFNGIVKVLLTVDSSPPSQDQHLFCTLLKENVFFKEGDIVQVTLEVLPKTK
jgi:hypothetical protein